MRAFLREYEGPGSEEYEDGKFPSVSYSMSWQSSGSSAIEVPSCGSVKATPKQEQSPDEQRNDKEQPVIPLDEMRNPLPNTKFPRDACGCPSIGSEGREVGLCAENLQSGSGCTYGTKCNLCRLPHHEVSSTSVKKQQRASAESARAKALDLFGVDDAQQTEQVAQATVGEWHQRQQKDGLALNRPKPHSTFSL
eukprot:TRINITY_DN30210_c0_g1_i1.p1 TRINITY_DN30210_c0_g1~~TRINITY_DN30210_c0_g1_i1.p1  ORF type:complete len:194 (+),score=20.53 TRINITY_DN30210_c0_g1_i1:53-634(+)